MESLVSGAGLQRAPNLLGAEDAEGVDVRLDRATKQGWILRQHRDRPAYGFARQIHVSTTARHACARLSARLPCARAVSLPASGKV